MHCLTGAIAPAWLCLVRLVANLSTAYFRVRDAACYIQPTFVEIKIQFTSDNIFDGRCSYNNISYLTMRDKGGGPHI